MKAMSRFWVALVVSTVVMGVSTPSWAAPLMPDFPAVWAVGQAVAGQSTLGAGSPPPGYPQGLDLTVDWIVKFWGVDPGLQQPVWGYYYQIENPQDQPHLGYTVATFTIATPGPPFFAAGFLTGPGGVPISLDADFTDIYGGVPGHIAANYPNLGPPPPVEFEPIPGNLQNPTGLGLTVFDVTYFFGPPPPAEIASGNQSTILVAYAFVPPMYGIADADDTAISWRGRVPVPSPEPGTAVLLILGAVGMGILSRRYRRK